MTLHQLGLVALALAWSAGAAAQWQWVDKDGRKVFSDRPPPLEIPEKDILRQPHQLVRPAATATGDAESPANSRPAPAAKAGAGSASKGVDKELEERKAKAEAEQAAKEKAEEKKVAAARADNCSRAKRAKATLDSGQLMKHTNDKGEQVFLDDAARAAERKRAQAIIDSDCKP